MANKNYDNKDGGVGILGPLIIGGFLLIMLVGNFIESLQKDHPGIMYFLENIVPYLFFIGLLWVGYKFLQIIKEIVISILNPIANLFNINLLKNVNVSMIDESEIRELQKKFREDTGITDWYITYINNNGIELRKYDGKTVDLENVRKNSKLICTIFGISNVSYIQKDSDHIIIKFKQKIPTVKDNISPAIVNDTVKSDRLFVGCTDINGTPFYTEEEEFRGGIQGHGMIIGQSGTGKSVFVSSFLNNWLGNEERYKDISDLKVCDMKNGNDYNGFMKYDKFEYSNGDIENVLGMFKEVEFEYNKRNTYLKEKGLTDGKDLPKYIFIVDEVQTIQEMTGSSSLSSIEKNSWNEVDRILNTLASKARSVNISVFIVLQKGTSESINRTVRSNMRHLFGLKNENMTYLFNDKIIKENNLDPDDMVKGQLYYLDQQTNHFEQIFCQILKPENDLKLNKENDFEEDKLIRKEMENLTNLVLKVEEIKSEKIEVLEKNGNKTIYDNFNQLKNREKTDYVEKAKERMGLEIKTAEELFGSIEDKNENGILESEQIEELFVNMSEEEINDFEDKQYEEVEELEDEIDKELDMDLELPSPINFIKEEERTKDILKLEEYMLLGKITNEQFEEYIVSYVKKEINDEDLKQLVRELR